MCGIMGYVGKRPAIEVLIDGLKRLEYRGYDSAGVAFFHQNKIQLKKSVGKIGNVEKLLDGPLPVTHCGIGHTRWATHGKPTTQNAHPHQTGDIVLVHNGIIENYHTIREQLLSKGYKPESETDSELFGFLVVDEMKKGTPFVEAVRKSFLQLEGSCSVVILCEKEPDKIVGIRNGSPLVAATDPKGGAILASDAQPIISYTQDVYFMENGDMAVADMSGVKFFDLQSGKPIPRLSSRLDWSADKMDKQGFPHYMLKEIHEQPRALIDTLNSVLDRARTDPFPLAPQPGVDLLNKAQELVLVASGTSRHAAMLGQYWLERWAGIPCSVEIGSEFRYRDPVLRKNSLIIGITQSGETADTIGVIREIRKRGVSTLAVTNVRNSTISRDAHATFFTSAGPEIGVAATKTFLVQLLVLFNWAAYLGLQKGFDTSSRIPGLFDQLIRLPHILEATLNDSHDLETRVREVAKEVVRKKGFFFIGRGYSYPIALEGALKLKEIAYVHAEGFAGGELKHGPIAMIDTDMVVVVLAPPDSWREKMISNLQEVKARGATIVGIGKPDDKELKTHSDYFIPMPWNATAGGEFDASLYPFLITPVVQLLSYEIAVLKGTEVDQPRNLAKSVTVE